MRIALVIERMDPTRGGRETYTAQTAGELARRGHDVTVICHSAAWKSQSACLMELGFRGRLRVSRLRNFVADAARACREGRYDISHAMMPLPGADIYHPHGGTAPAARLASLRRHPVFGPLRLFISRIGSFRRNLTAALERRVIADENVTCLCVSEMVAREIADHFGRRNNVVVVPNGVRTPPPDDPRRPAWRASLRDRIGAGGDDVVFLIVANNFALKGVAEAIRAFARRRGDAGAGANRFLVVVGGDRPGRYARLARSLGVGGGVFFEPRTDNVFKYYAAADVLLLLSWYDSFGLTLMEAASWGIPSITTSFVGAASAAASAGGIIVDSPASAGEIASAMAAVADPARRSARAESCLRTAADYTLDRHVDRLVEVYEHLAKRP